MKQMGRAKRSGKAGPNALNIVLSAIVDLEQDIATCDAPVPGPLMAAMLEFSRRVRAAVEAR